MFVIGPGKIKTQIVPAYHVGPKRFLDRDKALEELRGMVTDRPFMRWLNKFCLEHGRSPTRQEVQIESDHLAYRARRRITKFPGE